jgi:predicted nuclease with TOPRIM domain
MSNKEITIDDLATMIAKGFNEVDDRFNKVDKRFDKLEKDVKLIKLDVEDVKLRLDNVAHRFELEEMKKMFDKRMRAVENKVGIKFSAA